MSSDRTDTPKTTALFDLHQSLGGRMVAFSDYMLPLQYRGIVAEHLHTRTEASLFDVSHMGQIRVVGADFETTAKALETLLPGDILGLKPGAMRYTVLLNDAGGIEDDLIVTRPTADAAAEGTLFIVVNAGRKHHDFALFEGALGENLKFELLADQALLAIQGPKAAQIIGRHADFAGQLGFMNAARGQIGGFDCQVSRAGYTGEDGFEISVANRDATTLAKLLLAEPELEPAGLGARDSLRLEAGLCLYGHDMDDITDPVTAKLLFAIGKRRRIEGGFVGAKTVLDKIEIGTDVVRTGIVFEGRMPVRDGADLIDDDGQTIGKITSGGFSPTLQKPIAMGYLPRADAVPGAPVIGLVRGKCVLGIVTKMPFVPQNYFRRPPDAKPSK